MLLKKKNKKIPFENILKRDFWYKKGYFFLKRGTAEQASPYIILRAKGCK
jgi:hypothetical protein